MRGQLDPIRHFLDKWQMHQALLDAGIADLRLPHTILLEQVRDAELESFHTWYVKPTHTWGGHHIAKVSKLYHGWTIEIQNGSTTRVPDTSSLLSSLKHRYQPRATIVQQAAPVATLNGQPFDVRTLCQRDQNNQWMMTGQLVRVGSKDSIVSNVGSGRGTVKEVSSVLQQLYSKKKRRLRVQDTLKEHSMAICSILDGYWPFEEVGIDFGLTASGQVWLFEVNTNDTLGGPSHELFERLPGRTIYQAIESRADERRRRFLH